MTLENPRPLLNSSVLYVCLFTHKLNYSRKKNNVVILGHMIRSIEPSAEEKNIQKEKHI